LNRPAKRCGTRAKMSAAELLSAKRPCVDEGELDLHSDGRIVVTRELEDAHAGSLDCRQAHRTAREQLCADGERGFVEIETWRVEEVFRMSAPGDAQAEKAARDTREIFGEILSAHARRGDVLDASAPRSSAALSMHVRVTVGSLMTASGPRLKASSMFVPVACAMPPAIADMRSSIVAIAAAVCVRMVPRKRTSSGITFCVEPP
jgi:hypothetical protein